ncbi:uncharacterized protein LOC110859668 [Folsomia candida]|uniref:uncharacterized protein LOC110859664 n=1 Tax=Folsomia candida TaxID=158441 RepID=UPI00160557AD|nr:uncharacterized protein LOC110859664 [Folsomia candida]XP_021964332.2 uncharacterized protein LOC110859668 [Folsomia candida]
MDTMEMDHGINVESLASWFDVLKLESFLGSGSFGYVFKAVRGQANVTAVKVIFIEGLGDTPDDETEKYRLLREYKLMKGKKHDNLVQILKETHKAFTVEDINVLLKIPCLQNNYKILDQFQIFYLRAQRGTHIPSLCIQMELCGKTLRQWLNINNETDNPELHPVRNRIVKDMCEGLKYLHGHNIIHRDFRPENILFSLSQDEEFVFPVKVGDFGLCRQIHSEETATKTLTPEIGNIIYRAPEANSANYGIPADLYSFGLVSWEVVQQIKRKDTRSMFYRLVHDTETSIVKRSAWWFRDWENTIISLTKRHPQDRIKEIDKIMLIDRCDVEVSAESVENLLTLSQAKSERKYVGSKMGPGGKLVSILKVTKDKISINTNATKSIFEKIGENYFAVYSINGPTRTGKSFMLSNFIRYLNHDGSQGNNWILNAKNMANFEWRGGTDRITVGIDLWSEPFWTTHNGRRVAIVLMDTQGSFDDHTTMQENAIIFAIATLLSSVLIFNVIRDVGEDVLKFVQFFSSFATLTVPEFEGNAASGELGDGAYQKLLFLVRDFQFLEYYQFGFYDDNHVPNEQQGNYKKDKLDSNPDQPTEMRLTHDQLLKSYKDVGVYLMPEPDKGFKQHDKLDNLDPEFASHVGAFVPLMLSPGHLVTKKIGGVEVTGSEMIKYVHSWAPLFEGNDLPEIKRVYQSVAESQFIIAKQSASTFYTDEMQKFLKENPAGVRPSALTSRHSDLIRESFVIYQSKSKLGGAKMDPKFSEEFTPESERLLETYLSINRANLKAAKAKRKLEKTQEEVKEQQGHRKKLEAEVEAVTKTNLALVNNMKEQRREYDHKIWKLQKQEHLTFMQMQRDRNYSDRF